MCGWSGHGHASRSRLLVEGEGGVIYWGKGKEDDGDDDDGLVCYVICLQ